MARLPEKIRRTSAKETSTDSDKKVRRHCQDFKV